MDQLLLCAFYFLDRIKIKEESVIQNNNIKEHLLISIFELVHNIGSWNRNRILDNTLLKLQMEDTKVHFLVGPIAEEGCPKLYRILLPYHGNKIGDRPIKIILDMYLFGEITNFLNGFYKLKLDIVCFGQC